MAAIRWIALSDLHLGALNSVLTSVTDDGEGVDGSSTSPVLLALADCIRAIDDGQPERAELVVLGDLFELALTTTEIAGATFGQFVCALRIGEPDAAVAPLIRFLPGNHDHRLWTRARDAHYLDQLQGKVGSDATLPESEHATALLPEHQHVPVRDTFVELLAARADVGAEIVVEQSYPNLGMVTGDGRRVVVLSHGHYVEPLYRLMSNLDVAFGFVPPDRMPHVSHIEADNGGWIDFFWSSMGDSGDVTGIVRSLYESLQSPQAMEEEIALVKRFIAKRYRGPRGFVESRLIAGVLRREIPKRMHRERHQPGVTLSKGAEQGLAAYVSGPVRAQLGTLEPEQATFVFGHTHKPFVQLRGFEGFANPVAVVNTGGWVVDSVEPESTKGAAVVVVDWDANVAVVRCFVQGDNPDSYRVTVTSDQPGVTNPLVEELGGRIDPTRDPWLSLGQALAVTVGERGRQLEQRLAAGVASARRESR